MDKSLILINITGRRYRCISTRGSILDPIDELLEIGKCYSEVASGGDTEFYFSDFLILIHLNDINAICYVEKECFELVRELPQELFLIPVTMN